MPWHELIKEVKVNENFSAVARVFLTACPRARLGMQCPSRLGTLPTPPGQKNVVVSYYFVNGGRDTHCLACVENLAAKYACMSLCVLAFACLGNQERKWHQVSPKMVKV